MQMIMSFIDADDNEINKQKTNMQNKTKPLEFDIHVEKQINLILHFSRQMHRNAYVQS